MPPPACRIVTFGPIRTPPTEIASAPLTHSELTTSCRSRSRMTWLAARDAFLGHVAEVFDTPGSVSVTVNPGPITAGGGRRELALVEAAQQLPASLVALEPAAPFGVHLGGQRVAPRGDGIGGGFRRPHAAGQHLLSFVRGGRDGLRLRDRGSEHGGHGERGEHLPRPLPRPAARRGAFAAFGGRGGVPRIQVVGQQRAQQRRHRDQRRRVGLVDVASGFGVVAAQRPSGINHGSELSASAAPPSPPGRDRAPRTTDTAPFPRSGTPTRRPG